MDIIDLQALTGLERLCKKTGGPLEYLRTVLGSVRSYGYKYGPYKELNRYSTFSILALPLFGKPGLRVTVLKPPTGGQLSQNVLLTAAFVELD